VEAQSADTHRSEMMGIAESILSNAEGLNPSYAGIAAQQAAGNRPTAIEFAGAPGGIRTPNPSAEDKMKIFQQNPLRVFTKV